MNPVEQVLAWLNDPTIKSVLLFLGGLILRRWSVWVNKAIPLTLLVISAVLGILKALFPGIVPEAHALVLQTAQGVAAQGMTVAAPHASWLSFVINVILVPVLVAVGAHSAAKSTGEYAAGDRKTT